jgi:hypothetical protein
MIKFSDLTEQQVHEICVAFAKREGIDTSTELWNLGGERMAIFERPDYPNSLDDMHRIIVGMGEEQGYRFGFFLTRAIKVSGFNTEQWVSFKSVSADCKQQFVAAALALGLIAEREIQ